MEYYLRDDYCGWEWWCLVVVLKARRSDKSNNARDDDAEKRRLHFLTQKSRPSNHQLRQGHKVKEHPPDETSVENYRR
jgi:hypothetical protein